MQMQHAIADWIESRDDEKRGAMGYMETDALMIQRKYVITNGCCCFDMPRARSDVEEEEENMQVLGSLHFLDVSNFVSLKLIGISTSNISMNFRPFTGPANKNPRG